MNLHSTGRSSTPIPPQENMHGIGGSPFVASDADRQAAARQMRYQLYLLDRSQRRPSIEEMMASVLEEPATDLPA